MYENIELFKPDLFPVSTRRYNTATIKSANLFATFNLKFQHAITYIHILYAYYYVSLFVNVSFMVNQEKTV